MGKIRQLPYNYSDKYPTEVRAQGHYAFMLEGLKNEFALSYPAMKPGSTHLKSLNN
ncbi:MAG: hypothetical protein LBG17_05950 [Bacteroidales bacterium]|jgi:hypothetical protein|nr:hypothetical protein [Bacteroidales bacterium]